MDTLLELFSFQGRANRSWYFWHIILDDVAMFTAIAAFIGRVLHDQHGVDVCRGAPEPTQGSVSSSLWAR